MAFGLRLESGGEWDSNPARVEVIEGLPAGRTATPSPALRLALNADFEGWLGDRWALSAGGGAAVRRLLRPEVQGEDLLVSEARAALSFVMFDGWILSGQGTVYDVLQRTDALEDARDFRSSSPSLRLTGSVGKGRVHAAVGWRWFAYKPFPAYDFTAPTASVGYRHSAVAGLDGGADWDWGLGLGVEQRRFGAIACAPNSGCPGDRLLSRRDPFVSFDADVTRTSDQLLGLGVAVQNNRSEKYGESLTRLAVHLRSVFVLPLEFSLAARAEVVLTSYADAVPVGHDAVANAFVTIDDEGRSNLRLDLSRPIGQRLEAGARYTLYSHVPGTGPVRFSRQIGLLYLAVSWSR